MLSQQHHRLQVFLHQPDTGSIIYDGNNFTAMDRKEKVEIRKEIGMLFQGSALFDSMTVEENVMFPLTMFTNLTKKEKTNLKKLLYTLMM